jgi:hypothetical protein
MVFQVELAKCRYPLHNIDTNHIWPQSSTKLSEGPIWVKLLDNGDYFVEDGRHRCIRALLRGDTVIDAEWFEDHAAEEIDMLDRIVHGLPTESKAITLHINGGRVYPSFGETKKGNAQDLYSIEEPRHTKNSPMAACGKYHVHDPHPFGEHMEEDCDGQVRN